MHRIDEREGDIGTIVPMGLMAVGAVALARRPALLGAALLGLLTYELFKERRAAQQETADPVERDSEDSFPASDPPGWSGTTARAG